MSAFKLDWDLVQKVIDLRADVAHGHGDHGADIILSADDPQKIKEFDSNNKTAIPVVNATGPGQTGLWINGSFYGKDGNERENLWLDFSTYLSCRIAGRDLPLKLRVFTNECRPASILLAQCTRRALETFLGRKLDKQALGKWEYENDGDIYSLPLDKEDTRDLHLTLIQHLRDLYDKFNGEAKEALNAAAAARNNGDTEGFEEAAGKAEDASTKQKM
ncbi:MAG: hypothetical protein LBB47_06330 [Spirochaetaceae bacterium]|nr:hypothetical protein [Spirochaetaceae bacterium]